MADQAEVLSVAAEAVEAPSAVEGAVEVSAAAEEAAEVSAQAEEAAAALLGAVPAGEAVEEYLEEATDRQVASEEAHTEITDLFSLHRYFQIEIAIMEAVVVEAKVVALAVGA